MIWRALAFALCVGWVCAASSAHAQPDSGDLANERAAARGYEMWRHDRAAWLGTDALMAAMPDAPARGLRGWVTETEGDALRVTFVRDRDGVLESLFTALYREETLSDVREVAAPLTPAQERLFRARRIAIEGEWRPCSNAYNSVVLPRDSESADGVDVDVYLMPGTTEARIVPIGGYYLFEIGVDADRVVRQRAFANSCLTLERAPFGVENEMLAVTHLLDPIPTEVHYFIAFTQGIPLLVATSQSNRVWQIRPGEE